MTATNIVNPSLGEKSTEVNMVRVAQAADSAVGKTGAPAKITVDGVDVPLEDGKFVYDDVVVDGAFQVAVDAPEDAHVYINNNCAASADYDKIPDHKIIRVIVQEGEKEPAIYILNLVEGELPDINTPPALADDVAAAVEAEAVVGEPYVVDLSGIFVDEDGDEITYKVTDHSGVTVDIPAIYSFTYEEPGTYTLVFTANDGQADSPTYTVTLTVSEPAPAYAPGWNRDADGDWIYVNEDGSIRTNGWAKDSKGWCYLGDDGKIVKSKWIKDTNGEWYYLKDNGYMAANEWAKDSHGWMYMASNGKITKGKWVKYKGEWYYLKANGYMAANEWAKDSKGWMYMDSSGKITKSKWVKYNGSWYYLKADGYMATGTQTINGKTYKFASSGKWIS
ncbi:MAG: hypothetical protein K6G78_06165 [bacterium]|nr:hypothetical protein [bacterium]